VTTGENVSAKQKNGPSFDAFMVEGDGDKAF
jgi:hypothetical protein